LSATISIPFVTSEKTCAQLAKLLTEAMKIETFLDRTHQETVGMLRFSDSEILEHRDGFGYANLGITGISRFFAEKFAGRADAFSESFKNKTVESARRMASSTGTFGLMVTKENDRVTQVETGRCFARIHLTATKLGLRIHPMSQILQEYDEMAALREELPRLVGVNNGTLQMLFRIGHADLASHSPRRPVSDFLTA